MENAVFLAKLLGAYYVIVSASVLINIQGYQNVIDDFYKSKALMYLAGVFAVVAGLLILQSYHDWTMDGFVVITISGWLALIKGICLLIFPNAGRTMAMGFKSKRSLLLATMLVMLIIGLWVLIIGYRS